MLAHASNTWGRDRARAKAGNRELDSGLPCGWKVSPHFCLPGSAVAGAGVSSQSWDLNQVLQCLNHLAPCLVTVWILHLHLFGTLSSVSLPVTLSCPSWDLLYLLSTEQELNKYFLNECVNEGTRKQYEILTAQVKGAVDKV